MDFNPQMQLAGLLDLAGLEVEALLAEARARVGTGGGGVGACGGGFGASGADAATGAKTVEFGKFTGRAFPVGTVGIQPYKKPRYIIELVNDYKNPGASPFFRVTAMGFGPRPDIQVILQTMYRN